VDLAYADAELAVQDLAAQVLGTEVVPLAGGFDRARWSSLADAGLLGIALPEAHGGAGLGHVALHLLLTAAGRTAAELPLLETLVLGAGALSRAGTPEQQASWLPRIASGALVLTAAALDAGSRDPSDVLATATPTDGGFRLDGTKLGVPALEVADRVVTPVVRADGRLLLALVPPEAAGCVASAQEVHGGVVVHDLQLDGVVVPETDVLGGSDADARPAWEGTVLHGVAAIASLQSGAADGALALAASHTASREQFGRPIATFQAVSQRLADAYIDVEGLRLAALQAAWRLEAGLPATDAVATAGWWGAEAGDRVLRATHHVHGGTGVDRDYPLHRLTQLLRRLEFTLGTATDHLDRLGRSLAAVVD
jgi:3-oxocholest-4-en-26-oyl-CoA dehydrogenase beta subunit